MIKDKEVCLFITLKCNQRCKFCHRFNGNATMDFDNIKKVIDKLTEDEINNITFTGGEPFLHPNIIDIVKYAKGKGVKSKIISNGKILAKEPAKREIYQYLDSLTLSLDTIDNNLNEEIGRGYDHFENVKTALESLKENPLKVNVNTVVSKMNLEKLEELGNFLKDYDINVWRSFKFIPLRETAKANKHIFEISKMDFKANKPLFTSFSNIRKIEFREDEDFEKYVLIKPEGNVVMTKNEKDVTLGNIFENSLKEILLRENSIKMQEKPTERIRTFIAYPNIEERNQILAKIQALDYVEIVGVSASGIDTYNKIVDSKPELVFANYDLGEMNGIELIKKSKEKLDKEVPIFNFIANKLSKIEFEQLLDIADDKATAVINERKKEESIINAIEEYKKLKES